MIKIGESNRIIKRLFGATVALLLLTSSVWSGGTFERERLFEVAKDKETSLAQALPEMREKRIILVGEYHDRESHHMAQLLIIKALHESEIPLAIGLEMFRADSQHALDSWVGGKMNKEDFQRAYYDNWNFPWPFYSMIFAYAREKGIPLVGLNVPRDVTRQVAIAGFESLSEKQKAKIPNVTCRVDRDYMDFIKRAYGAHAHGQLNFTYFCEAQLVWDKAMAIHALDYLKAHPNTSMVLLAGAGHAWKRGIPEQLRQLSELPYTVVLPKVSGRIEPGAVNEKDTDYIWLNTEE
ncbi:MAG: ChaN family lipoprotein [Desulfobacteraceae bacterium]